MTSRKAKVLTAINDKEDEQKLIVIEKQNNGSRVIEFINMEGNKIFSIDVDSFKKRNNMTGEPKINCHCYENFFTIIYKWTELDDGKEIDVDAFMARTYLGCYVLSSRVKWTEDEKEIARLNKGAPLEDEEYLNYLKEEGKLPTDKN